MRIYSIKISIISFIIFIISISHSMAQCAMCRATVENNLNTGETTVGAGLNYGIFYLLLAPYLMALLIGFIWYRNYRKQKTAKTKVQHY